MTSRERALELRRVYEDDRCEHANFVCSGCFVDEVQRAIDAAVAQEREECAKVAEDKAREHEELATHFAGNKMHEAAKAHKQYALVCNGSDGVGMRIRARGTK